MLHPAMSNEEIDVMGRQIYGERLRSLVETPENIGKQIVIDVETADYEVDADGLKTNRKLLAKRPNAALYGLRIGYNAAYAIGSVLERDAK